MIPKVVEDDLVNDFEYEEEMSKTYNLNGSRFSGFVDQTDSVKQAIFFMLNTERFKHPIYSWNYGFEIGELFGKPMDYVQATLKSNVKDCLLMDTRILDVTDFKFSNKKGVLTMTFNVDTIFGIIKDVGKVVDTNNV